MPEQQTRSSSQQALLIQIVTDMAEVKAGFKMLQDHEERIRELEKARWQTAWITAFASAALTALAVTLVSGALT
jgi:type IV secretory pathway component VirB8